MPARCLQATREAQDAAGEQSLSMRSWTSRVPLGCVYWAFWVNLGFVRGNDQIMNSNSVGWEARDWVLTGSDEGKTNGDGWK